MQHTTFNKIAHTTDSEKTELQSERNSATVLVNETNKSMKSPYNLTV